MAYKYPSLSFDICIRDGATDYILYVPSYANIKFPELMNIKSFRLAANLYLSSSTTNGAAIKKVVITAELSDKKPPYVYPANANAYKYTPIKVIDNFE